MGLLGGLFRDRTPPRLLMLSAVALMTLSQFFAYFETPGRGLAGFERQAGAVPGIWDGLPVTGWQLHPQAVPILALLFLALIVDDLARHPLFRRFGYWIALGLFFAAMSPGAPTQAAGASMGGIAFLMALVATIWQQLLPRMVPPLPPEA